MLKKVFSLFLFMIIFTAPAIAREGNNLPHGKWWNSAEVAGQLKLSDNEVKILDDLYVNHKRKIIKLHAQIEEEQFELNNLIDSKTLNDEAVLNQSKRLEQARANLSTELFHFFLDVRKLLGFDRYQQLKSMFQTLHEKRKYDRFRNKLDRRHKGIENLRPSSYNDADSPEITAPPAPNIPPYKDNSGLSDENL